MSSYVKRRNCCLLKKSKKYFESIRQNTNEMLDVINEFTIKGEFCEFKDGDLNRLWGMRCQIGKVIEGWKEHTNNKLDGEIEIPKYYKISKEISADASVGEIDNLINELTDILELLTSKGFVDENNGVKDEEGSDGKTNYFFIVKSFKISTEDFFQAIKEEFSSMEFTELDFCYYTINFCASLHMVGKKLQAEKVPMYELVDVIKAPLVNGKKSNFKEEYDSNPDILIEDISEFLQAIDKLESLMKNLSIDNNQRDPDTEFCCDGNPPPGGKQSC